jgi:hypothetical protein
MGSASYVKVWSPVDDVPVDYCARRRWKVLCGVLGFCRLLESSFVLVKHEQRLAVGCEVEHVGLQITKGTNAVLYATVPIFSKLATSCCCSSLIRRGIRALSIVIGTEDLT